MTGEDISLITKITEWARNAVEYASGDAPKTFAADKKTAYACVLSIQQMGSLADRISLGARAETSHILHHLGRVFQENPPDRGRPTGSESKQRRKEREKKIAQGHAEDEYEQKMQ